MHVLHRRLRTSKRSVNFPRPFMMLRSSAPCRSCSARSTSGCARTSRVSSSNASSASYGRHQEKTDRNGEETGGKRGYGGVFRRFWAVFIDFSSSFRRFLVLLPSPRRPLRSLRWARHSPAAPCLTIGARSRLREPV